MDTSLQAFFKPRGVVVVGASAHPDKLGYGVARNLTASGYPGAIHLVNPKGGELFGRPLHPDLARVPDPVDLAVLVVPAAAAPETLRACIARGIRAAILVSSGFREAGPRGAALEAECLALARAGGLRLLGPNCIGMIDTHLPLDTTFLPPPAPLPGEIAFLSQSGAICAALVDWSRAQNFGFSLLVSLGNQADLSETDLIAPAAADANTRVLALYLESLPDGARFIEEAARAARAKPVVALKVGRSQAGQRAAASHTGALAGEEAVYDAAFARAGVQRADSTEQLFDWARALAWSPLPGGRRMAVLTNAGGPGVIAADALAAEGMSLADLSERTRAGLRELLPPAAGLGNPVDMLASATPGQYAACLRLLLDDPGVDGALIILPPPPMHDAAEMVAAILPVLGPGAKPALFTLMGGTQMRAAEEALRRARVPAYPFPEQAASALACLAARAEWLARAQRIPAKINQTIPDQARPALENAPSGSWLPQENLQALLRAYGLRSAPLRLARTAEQAAQFAREAGGPVVLKIASPDLPHKSDVGGVLLDVSPDQVADRFTDLLMRVRELRPAARIEGAHVQARIADGQDLLIGARRDPSFGPLIVVGSGGVEVEGLRDVAIALIPLDRAEAGQLLSRTWAGRRLSGFRSIPAADREGVLDAIMALAQLIADLPELAEIEINPLRALAPGAGAIALDARARLG